MWTLSPSRPTKAVNPEPTPEPCQREAPPLTLIMATYERARSLEAVLASVRKNYPELPIIVCNTGGPLDFNVDAYTRVLDRPDLEANVSAARNACLDAVVTPYTLVSDDDHHFIPELNLHAWVNTMTAHDLDVLGGHLIRENGNEQHWEATLHDEGDAVRVHREFFDSDAVHEVDIVLNFFVGDTEKLRAVRWNEQLPIAGEHIDFFYRAWKDKLLRIGYCRRFFAHHIRPCPSPQYQRMRNRRHQDMLEQLWGVKLIMDSRFPSNRADVAKDRRVHRATIRNIAMRRNRRIP